MSPSKIEHFLVDGREIADLLHDVPTPRDLTHASEMHKTDERLDLLDRRLVVSSMRFGRVYGFAQEQNGRIIQNLFPIKKDEGSQISSSSKARLEMHTETAFHPFKPEYVILLCVRDDPHAGTTLSALPDVLEYLDDETIDVLHQPEFKTSLDQSFQNHDQPDRELLTPVFFNQSTAMAYDRGLMRGVTGRARVALVRLSEAIDKVRKNVFLKTGDVLIIDNRQVVHGRTPFTPRYDGTDRWLKRVMVSTRLSQCDQISNGWTGLPVVTTTF